MKTSRERLTLTLCVIPEWVRKDYKQKVKEFYERGGRAKLEDFASQEQMRRRVELKRLIWDDKLGLMDISFYEGGLDMQFDQEGDQDVPSRFVFHNIQDDSPKGIAAFNIARRYIDLL